MKKPSSRLLIVLCLVAVLAVSVVDLFAKPWRIKRANDLLARAERAVCYEQPDAAGRLLQATERLDAKRTAQRRADITVSQERVMSDLVYARYFYTQCGNTDRVAILTSLEQTYTNPKAALVRALELVNQGEVAYAEQLVALAGKMNPDYAGLENVRNILP
jgi:hypothetical protein